MSNANVATTVAVDRSINQSINQSINRSVSRSVGSATLMATMNDGLKTGKHLCQDNTAAALHTGSPLLATILKRRCTSTPPSSSVKDAYQIVEVHNTAAASTILRASDNALTQLLLCTAGTKTIAQEHPRTKAEEKPIAAIQTCITV